MGGIDMVDLNEKELCVKVKRLRKPKLKGVISVGLIDRFRGFMDNRKGLIGEKEDRFYSSWIAKKQTSFDRYSAELFKVAGEVMKPAYILREKYNDQLKKCSYELEVAHSSLSGDTPVSVADKRQALYAQKQILRLEHSMVEMLEALKEIKITIDEAEHELNQILQEKKMIVEKKIHNYLRGAKKITYDKELIKENETLRNYFTQLGGEFEYELKPSRYLEKDMEKELEKDGVENEYIQ